MADNKPLPLSASAEGETAALQAQVIETGTLDKDHDTKDAGEPVDSASEFKKGSGAGFKNYIVSLIADVGVE